MIIAGTGHRPNKLGGYSAKAKHKVYSTGLEWLCNNHVFVSPVERVISGGALGWDQALAEAALSVGIPLTLALPFPDFWSKWPKESQDNLEFLVSQADKVVYVCDAGYAPWKMQERNKWMVDNSTHMLALWNGTSGGTANCIRYAEKVGRPIINLWEQYNDKNVRSVDSLHSRG